MTTIVTDPQLLPTFSAPVFHEQPQPVPALHAPAAPACDGDPRIGGRAVRRIKRCVAAVGCAEPALRARILYDRGDDDRRWHVREVDARGVPGSRGPRCLIFENPEIIRRLWKYPSNWLTLSDDALLRVGRRG